MLYTPDNGCLVVIDDVTVKGFALNAINNGTVNTTPQTTTLTGRPNLLCFNSFTTGCKAAAIGMSTGINIYSIV